MSVHNYIVVSSDGETVSVAMSREAAVKFALSCVEDTGIAHRVCLLIADVTPVPQPPRPAPVVTWRDAR